MIDKTVAELKAEIAMLRELDSEAATHVESVICLRTDFTGDPPYTGWKGLGLALRESLDERDKLRLDVKRKDKMLEQCHDLIDNTFPATAALIRKALAPLSTDETSPVAEDLSSETSDIDHILDTIGLADTSHEMKRKILSDFVEANDALRNRKTIARIKDLTLRFVAYYRTLEDEGAVDGISDFADAFLDGLVAKTKLKNETKSNKEADAWDAARERMFEASEAKSS